MRRFKRRKKERKGSEKHKGRQRKILEELLETERKGEELPEEE